MAISFWSLKLNFVMHSNSFCETPRDSSVHDWPVASLFLFHFFLQNLVLKMPFSLTSQKQNILATLNLFS